MIERTAAIGTMQLPDGSSVTIRPLEERDRDALQTFGESFPAEDLLYLEEDYQNQEIITRLVNAHAAENWRQIIALTEDGTMVGYSAARRLPGWSGHVADIRLLVSDGWRRKGVGRLLAQAIFDAARDLGTTKVMVQMMETQRAGREIFRRLGFEVEGTLHDHALGRDGHVHDVIVMAYFVR